METGKITKMVLSVFISLFIYIVFCVILKIIFGNLIYSRFYFGSAIWYILAYIVVIVLHVLLCWSIVGKLPKIINENYCLQVSIFTGVAIFICSFFWIIDFYDSMFQFMAICIGMSMCFYDEKNKPIDKKNSDAEEELIEETTVIEEDKTITTDVTVEVELDNDGDLEVKEEIVKDIEGDLLEK